jgi:predicted SprT family Zn-dependent metalloprotease
MIHPDRIFSFKEVESEDNPEYAVMTIDKTEGHHGVIGREVGRIRPRGMDSDQLRKLLSDMKAGRYAMENQVRVQAEPMWHHSCQYCRLKEDD